MGNITVEVINTQLELITGRFKKIKELLDGENVLCSVGSIDKLVDLKKKLTVAEKQVVDIFNNKGLDENKITRISMLVYHIVMSMYEYLNKNINSKISEKYFKLDDNHINAINSHIKNLYKCIDTVQAQDL